MSEATMGKAEAAWEAWEPPYRKALVIKEDWIAGYAASSADREAKVRDLEQRNEALRNFFLSATEVVFASDEYWAHYSLPRTRFEEAQRIALGEQPKADGCEAKVRAAVEATIEEARRVVWIQCDPAAIREINTSAIVARVMRKEQ